jgi:UDP-GlcNAc:undecaprenyl-phosphate GlcNAc-1-phosphate transferase
MLSIYHFYIFITALLTSTILVPYASRLAVRIGGFDVPGERKVHTRITPRLGGIAIFCSMLFTIIFFCEIDGQIKGFLAGAIVIFLTGLIDDLAGLTPLQKLAGEFLAAVLVVAMGDICVRHLGNPFGLGIIELGPMAIPFTIFGIVGMINAINLLDGLDGLAGGICTIACVSFAIISFTSGNSALISLVFAILGALLGFLRYNNYPAIIFMGDCGSLLLGYCMGVFSVLLAINGQVPVSPYIPLVILGVPVLDTLVVMVNRKRAGKNLFMPDKTHLHHRLLDLNIGHKYAVLIVFGISYLLSMVSILGHDLSDTVLLLVLATIAASVYGFLWFLASSSLRSSFSSSGSRLIKTFDFRSFVSLNKYLMTGIKYLLLGLLLLPVFLSGNDFYIFFIIPSLLLLVSVCFFLSRCSWTDQLLQFYVYAVGVFLIFALETSGRDILLLGVPLHDISHLFSLLLLITAGIEVFACKRTSRLIVSPFEYLILLIVLCVPLLPATFTSQYHLLTVAAKSVILFVGFKIILMRQIRRNRKILLAITVSMSVMVLRFTLGG